MAAHVDQSPPLPRQQSMSAPVAASTSMVSTAMPMIQYSAVQHQEQQQRFIGTMQPSLYSEQNQKQQLHMFWQQQMREMDKITISADFKTHQLPLARIKKIMKADEDVKMISAEAPVLFAKACELFILELTFRAWIHTEENKRRTLQRSDIAGAISKADIFDFLLDIVPREDLKDENLGMPWFGVNGEPVAYAGGYYSNASVSPSSLQFIPQDVTMPSGSQVFPSQDSLPIDSQVVHPSQ